MSALGVAAQPGTVWPRMPGAFLGIALAVGLGVGLAAGATMAVRTTTQTAMSAPPVTPAARTHAGAAPVALAPMTAYRQLVADIKVAESRRDFAAQYRFASQLKTMLTAETIGSIYQEHARLLAGLATAKANGNYHTASRFDRQLGAICGASIVKARLDFCN
jgi:hypothetical protein